MSTSIMTQTATGVNAQVVTPPAKTPTQRHESRREGFRAYCAGLSRADLTDPDEIRGWWNANTAAADCETAGYLQEVR